MRLLKQIGMFLLLPIVVLIDSHLGQFVNSFFPHFQIVSHFIFIFLLFETIEVSEYLFLVYCLFIGFLRLCLQNKLKELGCQLFSFEIKKKTDFNL